MRASIRIETTVVSSRSHANRDAGVAHDATSGIIVVIEIPTLYEAAMNS